MSPSHPGARRRPVGWLVAALALLLLAGLGAWLLWPGDGDRPETTAGTTGTEQTDEPSPSDEPTKKPTKTATSEEPTNEPSPTGTRASMQNFVEDYFSRVTSDPESTFALLTPQFQAESGGFDGYAGFWSTIASATAYDVRADPRTLTVSYTIDYVTTSGRTTTQQGRLQLQRQGDGYLIAGEG